MRHLPLLRRDRQGYDSGTLIAPARFLFYDSFCEIHSPMKHVSKLILFVDHHGFVKIVTIARFAIFQRRNLQEMTKVGEQWRSTTNLFPVTWPRGRFIGAHHQLHQKLSKMFLSKVDRALAAATAKVDLMRQIKLGMETTMPSALLEVETM